MSWLKVRDSSTSGPPTSLSTRSRPPLKRRSDEGHRLLTFSRLMIICLVYVSLISRQEVWASSTDGPPTSFSTRSRPSLKRRSNVSWRGSSGISSNVDIENSGRNNTCGRSSSMMKFPSVRKRKQAPELIPRDFLLRDSRLGFVRKVITE